MKSIKNIHNIQLLPHYFKKIGLLILVFTISGSMAYNMLVEFHGKNFLDSIINNETVNILIQIVIAVGFIFTTLASEKIEDERTIQMRLKAFMHGFIYSISLFILTNFLHLVFFVTVNDKPETVTATQLLVWMAIIYYISLHKQEKSEKNANN